MTEQSVDAPEVDVMPGVEPTAHEDHAPASVGASSLELRNELKEYLQNLQGLVSQVRCPGAPGTGSSIPSFLAYSHIPNCPIGGWKPVDRVSEYIFCSSASFDGE